MLFLPLLTLVAWGAGLIFWTLIDSSRLEQAAWTYGTTLSHDLDDKETAFKTSRLLFPSNFSDKTFTVNSAPLESFDVVERLSPLTYNASLGSAVDLPKTFMLLLAAHPSSKKELKLTSHLPKGPMTSLAQYGIEDPFDVANNRLSEHRLRVVIPGDNFKKSKLLKYSLWFESTKDTDYECKFLPFWGVGELTRAGGIAGIPLLGGVATFIEASDQITGAICPF